jgi:hypothetical protein
MDMTTASISLLPKDDWRSGASLLSFGSNKVAFMHKNIASKDQIRAE